MLSGYMRCLFIPEGQHILQIAEPWLVAGAWIQIEKDMPIFYLIPILAMNTSLSL
jgi:hypothetical protein